MTSLKTLILVYTTACWTVFNIAIAHLPTAALFIIVLRDSWIILCFFYFFKTKQWFELLLLIYILLIGVITLAFDNLSLGGLKFTIYGLRDFALILLVMVLLNSRPSTKFEYQFSKNFVLFCCLVALLEIVDLYILKTNTMHQAFALDSYYSNKGVDINLSGGFSGISRIVLPLYSPNLLGGLLALSVVYMYRSTSFTNKLLVVFTSIFTLTKNIVLIFSLYNLLKSRLGILFLIFSSGVVITLLNPDVLALLEDPLIKYHASSVIGHLNAFSIAGTYNLFSFIPTPIGENSIAAAIATNTADSAGIESSILARWSELGLWMLPFLIYLTIKVLSYRSHPKQIFALIFLMLLLFSATNNHPIMYLPPIMFFLYQRPNK